MKFECFRWAILWFNYLLLFQGTPVFTRAQSQQIPVVACSVDEDLVFVRVEDLADFMPSNLLGFEVSARFTNSEDNSEALSLNQTVASLSQLPVLATGCLPKNIHCLSIEVRQRNQPGKSTSFSIFYQPEDFLDIRTFSSRIGSTIETLSVAKSKTCDITCNEGNETKVEIDFFLTDYLDFHWRITDMYDTGNILWSCDRSSNQSACASSLLTSTYSSDKFCVPSDACLAFQAGGSKASWNGIEPSMINVTVDDVQVLSRETTGFVSVDLGESSSCPSPCRGDESVAELFIYRRKSNDRKTEYPPLHWSLDQMRLTDIDPSPIHRGIIEKSTDSSSFHYHRQCLLSTTRCAKLSLQLDPDALMDSGFVSESDSYQLSLDGVIYGGTTYEFENFNRMVDPILETVNYAGEDCFGFDICNGESLLEWKFQTNEKNEDWIPATRFYRFFYVQDYPTSLLLEGPADPNQEYHRFSCFMPLPGHCPYFGVDLDMLENGQIDDSYSIFFDNFRVGDRVNCGEEMDSAVCDERYSLSEIGGECSNHRDSRYPTMKMHGDSSSHFSTFTIAVCVCFGACLFLGMWLAYYHNQRERRNKVRNPSNLPGVGRNGLGRGAVLVDQAMAVLAVQPKAVPIGKPEKEKITEDLSIEDIEDNSYC